MPDIAGNCEVAEVAATFARHFIDAQNPMHAILPLQAAMEKLREGPQYLTAVHHEFIKVRLRGFGLLSALARSRGCPTTRCFAHAALSTQCKLVVFGTLSCAVPHCSKHPHPR